MLETNALTLAKKYQKKREWRNAVIYYDKHMNENKTLSESVYVNFAKCLRYIGDTLRAEELLLIGRNIYYDNERILRELYNLYSSIREWELAKSVVIQLIELAPNKANNYFLLGRIYTYLANDKMAEKYFIKGLEAKHNTTMKELIWKIQSGFTYIKDVVDSEYLYLGGKNNLGSIVHESKNYKYITKISVYSEVAKQEEKFYKDILEDFPILKELAPSYVCSEVIDNILYLTITKIDNVPLYSKGRLDIIETSKKLTSISYKDIVSRYPNPKYAFVVENRPISIVQFFTKIHEKKYNEFLFDGMYKLIEQNNYPSAIKEIILRLEGAIMPYRLYLFINPEKHYSLIHGDFIPSNIKRRDNDSSIIVLDWAMYTVGPRFLDIAKFFSATPAPFSMVKKLYLNDLHEENSSMIEKVFFLYALILLYITRLTEKYVESRLNDCIYPALDELETLIDQFVRNKFNSDVKSLIDNLEEEKNKKINWR